jgi:hypothetical protein
VLLKASSNPERLLVPIRLRTGEKSRKNKIPLRRERTKTNLTGKPGDRGKAIPSSVQ